MLWGRKHCLLSQNWVATFFMKIDINFKIAIIFLKNINISSFLRTIKCWYPFCSLILEGCLSGRKNRIANSAELFAPMGSNPIPSENFIRSKNFFFIQVSFFLYFRGIPLFTRFSLAKRAPPRGLFGVAREGFQADTLDECLFAVMKLLGNFHLFPNQLIWK